MKPVGGFCAVSLDSKLNNFPRIDSCSLNAANSEVSAKSFIGKVAGATSVQARLTFAEEKKQCVRPLDPNRALP